MKLISGRSHIKLGQLIANKLDISLTDILLDNFANTEIKVEIKEQIRGHNIYTLQTGCPSNGFSVSDYFFELCSIIDACRRSGVKSITCIIPCLMYAREDKKHKEGSSINSKLAISLLEKAGATEFCSIAIHSGQIQGFTDKPFHNLYTLDYQINCIKNTILNNLTDEQIQEQFILVSPDAGGFKVVDSCAQKLKMKYMTLNKNRDYSQKNVVSYSSIAGDTNDLHNKTAIIIDDIVDTFGTMIVTADILSKHQVKDVIIFAAHGIFSGLAIDRLNNCDIIKTVYVFDTIDQEDNMKKTNKIKVLDVSQLLTDFIKTTESFN